MLPPQVSHFSLNCGVAVYLLTNDLRFPPPEAASPEGVVAVGGDLSPERLALAYAQGIFPWPHRGFPLLWFSPDPRFVIDLDRVHVGRSLRKRIARGTYEVTVDTNFREVIRGCQAVPRPGQDGTWITEGVIAGYCALHERGLAHSIEAYEDGQLVGGLYGVSIGRSFCGESMFATRPDASKVAVVTALGNLRHLGFHFVDCQVYTDHLARFGAQEWRRPRYLDALRKAASEPSLRGPWSFPLSPAEALSALRPASATAR